MKGNGELVRIIPAPAKEGGRVLTQGTQVMVGDTKITGITRIELVADVNDVWRARIDLMVQPPDLSAVATFHRPTLWQRFCRWLDRDVRANTKAHRYRSNPPPPCPPPPPPLNPPRKC